MASFGYFQQLATDDNNSLLQRYRAALGPWAPPVSAFSEAVYDALQLYAAAVRRIRSDSLTELVAELHRQHAILPRGEVALFGPHQLRRALRWWLCSVCAHEWQSSPKTRTVSGCGCTSCTLSGTSKQEIRLRHELAAAGVPVQHPYPSIPVLGRKPGTADIVVPSWGVVIEFDGYYTHSFSGSAANDRAQTDALMGAGWTVLRGA